MPFIQKDIPFSKKWFVAYSLVILGAFVLAAGYALFIVPYNLVPGGVYGISIIVHYLTQDVLEFLPLGFPVGIVGLILYIPLTLLGLKVLGPRFGAKTITGFILSSFFIDLLSQVVGENDPMGLNDDILLASIFGGVLIGVGLGLIFKSRATSGGSDIVAMVISKYTKWPMSQLLIYIDSTIVILGLVVFKDWKIPLYSWITIYVTARVVDMVIEGMDYEKMVLIVTSKPDEIKDIIINDLNRSGTFLMGEGMYNSEPKKMIHTVVNRRELSILEDYIQRIDPDAFLTVVDAREILGNGFKSLSEKVNSK